MNRNKFSPSLEDGGLSFVVFILRCEYHVKISPPYWSTSFITHKIIYWLQIILDRKYFPTLNANVVRSEAESVGVWGAQYCNVITDYCQNNINIIIVLSGVKFLTFAARNTYCNKHSGDLAVWHQYLNIFFLVAHATL